MSDHGFSRIDQYIPTHSFLKKLHLDAAKNQPKPVELLTQGGSLMIYILDQSHRTEIEKKLAKAYAKEKGVTLLPFLLNGVAGNRELNQGDGMHPNNKGERIVAENVWRGLKPILDSIALNHR